MSYSDYMAGFRDGLNVGFNAGYRKGYDDWAGSGYLAGYRDGYKDASLGLPYQPTERYLEYRSNYLDPLPKIDPLPLSTYNMPKIDPLPLPTYNVPKIEPILPIKPDPVYDWRGSNDSWSTSAYPFGREKKPWEY